MIQIRNFCLPLCYGDEDLTRLVSARLGVLPERILRVTVSDRAISINEPGIPACYLATLRIHVNGREEELVWGRGDKRITLLTPEELFVPFKLSPDSSYKYRPVVVGAGPAGLFAALVLATSGARPILIERGRDIPERDVDVKRMMTEGTLCPESNVVFGAGGAGTYSDGKLKPGKMDPTKRFVLETMVASGSPEDILADKNPHVGTDVLRNVVTNILRKIREYGGDVLFSTRLVRLISANGQISGAVIAGTGGETEIPCDRIVLAIGHGARDTVASLYAQGVRMEARPFGVGVRIEHPQEYVNRCAYKDAFNDPRLPAASYRMVVHLTGGRSVYTFCMCPGGLVVPATNETDGVVTNGMSLRARSGKNANAAILVSVLPEDIGSLDPLAGFEFQKQIEHAAYRAAGGGYRAPVQRLGDFLEKRETSSFGEVLATYRPGTAFAPADAYLPAGIAAALRAALPEMGAWMPGYLLPDAILTGAETRSTSPVRMLRDDNGQAPGYRGLYPCGEGAGYAGGILSSAVDGIRAAECVLRDTEAAVP